MRDRQVVMKQVETDEGQVLRAVACPSPGSTLRSKGTARDAGADHQARRRPPQVVAPE
jgi:hypothetical protein